MKEPPPVHPRRRSDRRIYEGAHDPYKAREKLQEPTFCPQCTAVFHDGRWHWALRPVPAHEALCPACRRINDAYPAGVLTISGSFAQQHEDEVLGLVRHQEEEEKSEHPLHRIMGIAHEGQSIVVDTTDIHLPRRIGEALHHAYQGDLDFHYDEEGHFIRVTWSRD
jgi:hypothetical protein